MMPTFFTSLLSMCCVESLVPSVNFDQYILKTNFNSSFATVSTYCNLSLV